MNGNLLYNKPLTFNEINRWLISNKEDTFKIVCKLWNPLACNFVHSKNADKLKNAERLESFTFSMNVLTKYKGRVFWFSKFRIDRFLEFESTCRKYWLCAPGC